MMYTWHSDCRGSIVIGVHCIFIRPIHDLSQTIYIDGSGPRTFVKVGLKHVWGPREGDNVVLNVSLILTNTGRTIVIRPVKGKGPTP